MKYKVGDEFTYRNRSNKFKQVKIEEIYYKFDSRLGNSLYVSESDIDSMLDDGELSKGTETYKEMRIKQLEEELGVKLEIK